MKFSEQWLRERLQTNLDSQALQERLTMSGLEVDGVEPAAPSFSGVVVARVENIESHPDADKLKVCEVNIGETENLTIVCGAANVQQGKHYPLAKVGAVLPGDFRIKASKLRGVKSYGMLCSAKEIGLAEEADGLLPLSHTLDVGTDIREALRLDDSIIELSLTPNRGDCLSINGIARDASALSDGTFTAMQIDAIPASVDSPVHIDILASEHCPRYAGRYIQAVNADVDTPVYIKERLRRSGVRSIHVLVDITNYVMLELGQPMHAFDADTLKNTVCVRLAEDHEKVVLLDGQECTLSADTLVIADSSKPIAMAGIMGGNDTAVSASTKNVFLESAYFNPLSIIGKARQYGLHTDSSHRFERGVDYTLQERAIERATQLILETCGGQPGPVQLQQDERHIPVRHPVKLKRDRIKRVLGIELEDAQVERVFQDLDMQVEKDPDGWQVTPPAFRFDISIEVDLIEELARVVGYDNIDGVASGADMAMHPQNDHQQYMHAAREVLIQRGYQEAVVYSFIDPGLQQLFQPESSALELANPIASDLAVMRTSLLPGLVQTVAYNLNRQQERPRLFESGLVFLPAATLQQRYCLAGAITGDIEPTGWDNQKRHVDFYDIKADVEELLMLAGIQDSVEFLPGHVSFLHPGKSAAIKSGEIQLGWVGALHPSIQQQLELTTTVYLFELEISSKFYEKIIKFDEFSRFPSIKRDISVLVDQRVAVAEAFNIIRNSASDLLSNLQLFDVYQGEGIEIGKKSLTFGLTFQQSSRTLTDSEVESLVGDILGALHTQLGATLRE